MDRSNNVAGGKDVGAVVEVVASEPWGSGGAAGCYISPTAPRRKELAMLV